MGIHPAFIHDRLSRNASASGNCGRQDHALKDHFRREALQAVTSRPPLSPWLVAVLFAPTALLLWAIAAGIIPVDQKNLRTVLQAIALAQLFLAVTIYEIVPGLAKGDRAQRPAWQRLMLALGVLIVTQVAHLAVAEKAFASIAVATALAALAQQVVTIALAEELWFRGLWMRAAAGRPLLAVFGGAAGFGLYHLHQGWEWVATSTALGLLFAVARWYGAPIWALALSHGLMNWLNMVAAPGAKWRLDPALSRGMFIGLVLFGTAIMWLLCRRPEPAARAENTDRPK
jgi:hypothetical protein